MISRNQTSPARLTIVGGGTAGWMTAAVLARQYTREQLQITVIASEEEGGIGVGEATIPSIHRLLHLLDLDESRFLRETNATWKLGIQFCDWSEPGKDYWHPFGVCGAHIDGRDLFPFWLRQHALFGPDRPYHSYSLQWAAALAGKCPHGRSRQSPIAARGAYAFHLSADALATLLKDTALANGVDHVDTRVAAIANPNGCIESLRLENGEHIDADLYVDCTGFQALLAEQSLSDPWVDWSEELLCDKALALRLPKRRLIPSHTVSQAVSCGWIWQIPLYDTFGMGLVYSSQHASEAEAEEILLSHTGSDGASNSDIRPISMKIGRRTAFWKQNVVAIGLSAGFVEPLESSGLHLTQIAVERLSALLPSDGEWDSLRETYNQELGIAFDEIRDFIRLHYELSRREESFWKAARSASKSSKLKQRIRLFRDSGSIGNVHPDAFPDTSYNFLLTGHDIHPQRIPALALAADGAQIQEILEAIRNQNREIQRELPLHEEVLKRVHTPPLSRAS